jgi:hypothetical protein
VTPNRGNRGPIQSTGKGPIVIFERAKTATEIMREAKIEDQKPEEPKPEEEKKDPPADPSGRGPPRGPPSGPPGRGAPGRGAPTGPPGRGAPGGRVAGGPPPPPGRGGAIGPSDGRGAAVPMAPTPRGRGAPGAGRGGGRGPGRGPAAKAEIKPTKPPIVLKTKMKPFFWKRVILAPDAPKSLLWKSISEEKINQDEIEALYADAKANAPPKEGADDRATVKVRGPTKRTFFSGEENQKLQIALNQLPRPEDLIRACIDYDEKLVSST